MAHIKTVCFISPTFYWNESHMILRGTKCAILFWQNLNGYFFGYKAVCSPFSFVDGAYQWSETELGSSVSNSSLD